MMRDNEAGGLVKGALIHTEDIVSSANESSTVLAILEDSAEILFAYAPFVSKNLNRQAAPSPGCLSALKHVYENTPRQNFVPVV
jgi:hypothetical protein